MNEIFQSFHLIPIFHKTIVINLLARIVVNKLTATQPVITCSKLTIEILEQGVKYVQS